ncbi:MAG: outer membrane lipoprotein carrier protein LolA [Bacteroidales bacterium]|nr:outer membrane lipoprotein carrier protein LolA [Bacteroidales bacterium]
MIRFCKHIIFACCVFCLSCNFLSAQSQQNAIDLLNRAANAYEQSQGITAAFKIRTFDSSKSLQTEIEGSIAMQASRFYLEVPDEMKAWFDGRDLWTLIINAQEVNLSTPSPEELLMLNPVNIFSLYKQGYQSRLLGDKQSGKQSLSGIELKAQEASAEISRIVIYVDKNKLHPAEIVIYQRDGNHAIINIYQYQTNQNHPNSRFLFPQKDYPMVEVIDLR